jgi:hypothetical protein
MSQSLDSMNHQALILLSHYLKFINFFAIPLSSSQPLLVTLIIMISAPFIAYELSNVIFSLSKQYTTLKVRLLI